MNTNTAKRKINGITEDIERYSVVVPCGATIFAIGQYIRDYLDSQMKEDKARLKEIYRKGSKITSSDIEERKKIEDKLKIIDAPQFYIKFVDFPIEKAKVYSADNDTKYIIILSKKASDFFLAEKKPQNCPNAECPTKTDVPKCAKCKTRNCELKKNIRHKMAHELAHIVFVCLKYKFTNKKQQEDLADYFAKALLCRRENYMVG